MGKCLSCGKQKENEIPDTVPGFLDKDIDLKFKVELSNFKGKKLTEGNTYILIKFGTNPEFRSDKMYDNNNPDYKINTSFIYSDTTRNLVKNFLVIILMGGPKDEKLGMVHVNLYKIATGAIHNNFTIISKKGSPGKISFDIKMSQFFKITIKSCVLVGKLYDSLTEKHYFYNIT